MQGRSIVAWLLLAVVMMLTAVFGVTLGYTVVEAANPVAFVRAEVVARDPEVVNLDQYGRRSVRKSAHLRSDSGREYTVDDLGSPVGFWETLVVSEATGRIVERTGYGGLTRFQAKPALGGWLGLLPVLLCGVAIVWWVRRMRDALSLARVLTALALGGAAGVLVALSGR